MDGKDEAIRVAAIAAISRISRPEPFSTLHRQARTRRFPLLPIFLS
ncbi:MULTISPECIES: hypothetical protein [unclassified Sphingobium]|nr:MULTISPECIES: hypothetical protein [unclassified Sphingobium]